MYRIESLLSARLFLVPQVAGERIFFLSNMSGRLSLYAMDAGGSVPEPLLPPEIALQNPHLIDGHSFYVLPKLKKIVVMLDKDGDENYRPMWIPLTGGYPEPLFGETFTHFRSHLLRVDEERNLIYFNSESRSEPMLFAYRGNLKTGEVLKMGGSKYGYFVSGVNKNHTKAIVVDGYTAGDNVMYLWDQKTNAHTLLAGKPLEARKEGEVVPLTAFGEAHFTDKDRGLLFYTALFSDAYGLGYLSFDDPQNIKEVKITGVKHKGVGVFTAVRHLKGKRYMLSYNIDGCSWIYEGAFDETKLQMKLDHVVCGKGKVSKGVLETAHYDKQKARYSFAFSTATTPTQLYTVEGKKRNKVVTHTRENVIGIPSSLFSAGEEASFTSFDGTRVSARLYLPAKSLGFSGRRPLVYYVHGGPQSQERPDFAWFSMPLIQFLTLKGFAVFVPNVRGSSGYGMSYMKQVDRDWGGKDRLDHVHAMTKVLVNDSRLDVGRAAVVGRSYGGYMTLTLASRHPELWSAAVDMFGPYDLTTFMDRLPETWKPYFVLALGDPLKDKARLLEQSPVAYIDQVQCPMLVIQGKNDPRVIEQESRDVVERLRSKGKQVEYLMFENEGHDVLKFENRVRCYNAITDFFVKHLKP